MLLTLIEKLDETEIISRLDSLFKTDDPKLILKEVNGIISISILKLVEFCFIFEAGATFDQSVQIMLYEGGCGNIFTVMIF